MADSPDILNEVTLTTVALPEVNTGPVLVDTAVPDVLYVGQTITVVDGGEIESRAFFFDSTLNVEDGVVGGFVTAADSEINISGGVLERAFGALSGSVVNISGGVVERFFEALPGSEVNISGGQFGSGFLALPGSDVELIGGAFELNGESFVGSTITLDEGDTLTGVFQDCLLYTSPSPRD